MGKLLFETCCVLLASCFLVTLAADNDAGFEILSAFGTPFNPALITDIRRELTARVDSIWMNHPAHTVCSGCLIDHWHQNSGTSMGRSFHVSQMGFALAGMPPDVVEKVKQIVFGNKVIFEMFRHTVNAPNALGHYLHYVGIARRQGDIVDIAVLKGEVIGRLVPKYTEIHHRICGRIMWWECCCRVHVEGRLRGYSHPEIVQIEIALRAESVRRLRERAQDISF